MNFPTMLPSAAYEPQVLSERHQRILQMKHMGMKHCDIAKELSITPQNVLYVVNSQLGQDKLAEMALVADREALDAKDIIDEYQVKAAEYLGKVVSGEMDVQPALRVKTAQDMLDRGGHGKVQKIDGEIRHGYFGKVGVDILKKRAEELGIIDVTPQVEAG